MIALPAVIILARLIPHQPYAAIFIPTFQSGMLFWALFMGVSLFSAERGQKGMEYLLSLPYSRLQLLGIKVLPRLLSILFFYLVFLVLYYQGGKDFAALSLFSFSFLYFVLFLISLSLSSLSDNFLVLSLVSLFVLVLFMELFFLIPWLLFRNEDLTLSWSEINSSFVGLQWSAEDWLSNLSIIFSAIFLLCPLVITFIVSFKKFDARPSRIFGRRYLKFFVPLLFLGILCASLTIRKGIDLGHKEYYLTQDHKLIEWSVTHIKMYDNHKVSKLKDEFYSYPYWDEPPYLYLLGREHSLLRLNTNTTATELIYQPPKSDLKRNLNFAARRKYEKTIALFEPGRAPDEIQLVLIDVDTKNMIRIPFRHDFFKEQPPPQMLNSAVRDGKRCWLVCFHYSTKHPLRLWEDGRVENLEYKEQILDKSSTDYVNGMLILTNANGMIYLKEKANAFVAIKKISQEDKYWRWNWSHFPVNRDSAGIKELYGKSKDRLVRLSLETLEFEDIGEWKKIEDGYSVSFHYLDPNECYYAEINWREQNLKIFRLEGRQMMLLKIFKDFRVPNRYDQFEIFKGGIVIQRGKKVQVYSLPDFQEIKYKKLG
jgi:ABC-type transport system involved in multi-copper enzyme maturation permease subunit